MKKEPCKLCEDAKLEAIELNKKIAQLKSEINVLLCTQMNTDYDLQELKDKWYVRLFGLN
jgi:hypothetical protein